MSSVNSGYTLTGPTVAKLAAMYRASKRDNAEAPPPHDERGFPGRPYFWGVVTTAGPLGTESDYTDARYWIQRQCVSNAGGSPTDAATFAQMSGVYSQTITATNFAELANGSHTLKAGQLVQVWCEYDFTNPTPFVRYLIGQPPQSGVPLRIDNKIGSGGIYTGPMLTGTASANSTTTNLESDPMPLGMNVGSVQCIIVNIEETGQPGWRLPVGGPNTPVYALGEFQGMSTDSTPVPIFFIRGAMGDMNSLLTLPNGSYSSGIMSPNSIAWDWNTTPDPSGAHPGSGFSLRVATAFGYDGTTNASGGTTVTTGGSKRLWLRCRRMKVDARGVVRNMDAEVTTPDDFYVSMKAVTVGIASMSGGNLIWTPQTIYVPDYDDPEDPTTLISACT